MLDEEYIVACENRRKSVEKALAIVMTATNGPDEKFMNVLDSYIMGEISLEEMEARGWNIWDRLVRSENL